MLGSLDVVHKEGGQQGAGSWGKDEIDGARLRNPRVDGSIRS